MKLQNGRNLEAIFCRSRSCNVVRAPRRTGNALRVALGVRYARYTVGLSREDSAGGFDPTYQFALSGMFR